MSFRIKQDKYELGYARTLRRMRDAVQTTFEQEKARRNLTHQELADELKVDRSTVSKRLAGSGNVTLRTLSDLFIAMGREPFENLRSLEDLKRPPADVAQKAANVMGGAEAPHLQHVLSFWDFQAPACGYQNSALPGAPVNGQQYSPLQGAECGLPKDFLGHGERRPVFN